MSSISDLNREAISLIRSGQFQDATALFTRALHEIHASLDGKQELSPRCPSLFNSDCVYNPNKDKVSLELFCRAFRVEDDFDDRRASVALLFNTALGFHLSGGDWCHAKALGLYEKAIEASYAQDSTFMVIQMAALTNMAHIFRVMNKKTSLAIVRSQFGSLLEAGGLNFCGREESGFFVIHIMYERGGIKKDIITASAA